MCVQAEAQRFRPAWCVSKQRLRGSGLRLKFVLIKNKEDADSGGARGKSPRGEVSVESVYSRSPEERR